MRVLLHTPELTEGTNHLLLGITIVLAIIAIAWVLWPRQSPQHRTPKAIRMVGVKVSRFLLRLDLLTHKYHPVIPLIYIVIIASVITGNSVIEKMGSMAEIVVYSFYGLVMFTLVALYLARRLLDPVPQALTDDVRTPLDLTQVSLIDPDSNEKFNQLVDLGEEAFAAWGGSRDDRYLVYSKFYQANRDTFKLIMRTDMKEPIGFSCVIPLNENAFRQFRLGILDSWDFSPDNIPSTSDYLCLNAIYLQRTFLTEHTRAASLLCHHIAIFVRGKKPLTLPVLVADGLTVSGRRFLKRYGFESCYRTKDHTPIYELDLSRQGILSDPARAFANCLNTALNAERPA